MIYDILEGYYILDDTGEPVKAKCMEEWREWRSKNEASLQRSQVGEVVISTVFLGLDHSWWGQEMFTHAPVVFETMIFGGEYDCWMERYTRKEEALERHTEIVERLSAGLPPEEEEG